ncbi:TIGR03016 family PEP-CTERM system-associated outer membrane protein [Methyloversatilis thermotolerans]|uniref:TIGR03016 family PEP-CTERM system-associated outer membrane protein n=1 Tax=Methyloversatilis thermotolerans TaxID=1346290 RepID=UPI00035E7B1C|nr:TIGR03016 family PEP-CTERM system-associated outer membrane protein [Methyloversatilis thermotolerans]
MRLRRLHVLLSGLSCTALGVVTLPAHAENWRVTTGMSTRAIVSDNINFSATAPSSDTLIELSPNVRLSRTSPRLTLDASYLPRYLYYADDTYDDRLSNGFSILGRAEVVDDFFFLDARAVSTQRSQSVFNAVPTDNTIASNQLSQSRTYSITPSLRGTVRLGDVATWKSSYNIVRSDLSGGTQAGTLTSETFTGTLASTPAKVGWQVDVSSTKTDSDYSQSTDRKRIVGSLNYRPDATVTLTGRYGYEDTNFSSQRSGATYGAGVSWRPDPRTSMRADVDQRPYGRTNTINLSHRLPRTTLSATYNRNLTTRAEALLSQGEVDRFDFLETLPQFQAITDQTQREQAMQAFLTLRGLSRFDSIQGVILSDRQFLQSRLQLSASYSSSRGLLSLTVFRTTSDSGVGGRSTTANDDFSLSPVITQRGWTANYNHKVSALSSVNLSLTSSKSDGQAGTGINADRDVLNATWTRKLGAYTNGSIGLRMTRATVTDGDVDENAVIATLSTRFN